ncbi:MAG TPA: cation:proton antiporter [Candidatus Marinimicrobia bacterium]|nr:cation:proton antiporter [Candidatus Neomarinimicrobiota bacterium]HRS52622.1 cation:proton antiporter [Candidatus Neomarinimicrobiota bacterium]HRU92084.1 cation:proton antiporter [Candidatus Neomarinimicrobiota bacterium]
MEITLTVMLIGVIIFSSHLFSAIYSRTKIPDVLFLFLIGFLIGPILGLVKPSHFGAVGQVFTTITLIMILFESGIGISLKGIRKSLKGLLILTFLNFIATVIVVGGLTFLFTKLGLIQSLMVGTILGGTSSAIVIPIIDQLEMLEDSKRILMFESIINDVLCVVLTFSLLQAYKLGEIKIGLMTLKIIATFVLAAAFGIVGAIIWSAILNRIRNLQNSTFTTLAFVFIVYGIVELLGFSGAIAALVFGFTISNVSKMKFSLIRYTDRLETTELDSRERDFFSEISFLLKTFFFIYIGISMQISSISLLVFGLLVTIVVYIIRVPIVSLAIPNNTPVKDATLLSVVIPKGLAAAVLATVPLQQGVIGGELIQSLTYTVVLLSIIMTSVLIFFVDKTKLAVVYRTMLGKFRNSKAADSQMSAMS